MREWQGNDGHFQIKVNPLDFFWGSSRPIRGLDFEPSTNRKPRFWQFLAVSSILITAILSSFRHSTIILSFKARGSTWFVILSFQCHSLYNREAGGSTWFVIPSSFKFHSITEWCQNEGMTGEWRTFLNQGKPLRFFLRVLSTNQRPRFWALDQ